MTIVSAETNAELELSYIAGRKTIESLWKTDNLTDKREIITQTSI